MPDYRTVYALRYSLALARAALARGGLRQSTRFARYAQIAACRRALHRLGYPNE